ncbi:hypothetical protein [Pontibacter liquoris]|uniref:hypothetical protein n=1 Tax=Pontibacter liquoris TaxID=2905677 RepID=UPI001FA7F1A9|nr:hypothetical protein [Pontibacter liquoris]
MKKIVQFLLLAVFPLAAAAQNGPALSAPAAQPTIFAPGIVSAGGHEFNATFTPDGNTLYFSRATINWAHITLMESKKGKDGT